MNKPLSKCCQYPEITTNEGRSVCGKCYQDFSHQVTPEEGCKHETGTLDILRCKTCLTKVAKKANEEQRKLVEPSPIQGDWEKDLTGIMMSHEVHVFQKINNQVYPDLAISRSAIKDLEKVVKVFISNLLNSEKARILEKVRGMRKENADRKYDIYAEQRRLAHNQAIKDILEELNKGF